MLEKIKAALETKYSNIGFGAKAIEGVASYLSTTVKEESEIETAVSGVESLLKSFQGDIDRLRNEKSGLQKEVEKLRKTPQPDPKKEEAQPDLSALIEAALGKVIDPIKVKLDGIEKEKKQTSIISSAKSKVYKEFPGLNKGLCETVFSDLQIGESDTFEVVAKNAVEKYNVYAVAAGIGEAKAGVPGKTGEGKIDTAKVDEVLSQMNI